MSKKVDGRKNNIPPKNGQFGQPGGNPINKKGAPKKKDRMLRLSKQTLNEVIMNEAFKTINVNEGGHQKTVAKIFLIIAQLSNKAAKGDTKSIKLMIELMKSAATENDANLYEWTLLWGDMQAEKLSASRNPGSLEHYNAMYRYYIFKKDIRRVEGEERWPFEPFEPCTDEDWHLFIDHHDKLKSDPEYTKAPWPLDYPSDILKL